MPSDLHQDARAHLLDGTREWDDEWNRIARNARVEADRARAFASDVRATLIDAGVIELLGVIMRDNGLPDHTAEAVVASVIQSLAREALRG